MQSVAKSRHLKSQKQSRSWTTSSVRANYKVSFFTQAIWVWVSGCIDGSGCGHAEYLQLNTALFPPVDIIWHHLSHDDCLEDMRDYQNCSVVRSHKATRCYIGFSCVCCFLNYGRFYAVVGFLYVSLSVPMQSTALWDLFPTWCVTCWVECYALHANSVAVASWLDRVVAHVIPFHTGSFRRCWYVVFRGEARIFRVGGYWKGHAKGPKVGMGFLRRGSTS